MEDSGQPRPILAYDGDCGFCRRWIARWRRITGDRVEYRAAADCDPADVPAEQFGQSVVLFEPDGSVRVGADAVFRSLATARGWGWLSAAYRRVPGFAAVTEAGYRFVARHRLALSRVDRFVSGTAALGTGYATSSWLFLRALALVQLVAFVSLWVQVEGLIGSNGILPIEQSLERAQSVLGSEAWLRLPTLCWLSTSDAFLHVLCAAGCAFALLLLFGALPLPSLVGSWACYLSLVTAGSTFLTFQWDSLLLETTLTTALAVPLAVRGRSVDPPVLARLLLWWLCFRLMFLSGVVKLTSGDPTWRDLTALSFHHETQPLPSWISWHVHHLPDALHAGAVAATFVVELVVPFAFFGPRRLRHAAALACIGLQASIALTGNYGFFNLLSAVLCLPLLDDAAFPLSWQRRLPRPVETARFLPRWLLAPAAAFIVAFTAIAGIDRTVRGVDWPAPVRHVQAAVRPFVTFNAYGLFAVMTTRRPEIVVEGSRDGVEWREYELPYKPGDLRRAPPVVPLHMPRLDWRAWFAALGSVRGDQWVLGLVQQLLRGSPEVEGLFETVPFEDRPPTYVRVLRYEYRFSDRAHREASGQWWTRELVGLYCPVAKLDANGEPTFIRWDGGLPPSR